jgi:[acyl-carrier-protein] S-malonyltransferase
MRYALVFPGQGSQKLGMGSDFRRVSAGAGAMFDAASRLLGYDLADLCEHGPAEALSDTLYTQPALYVTACAGVVCLRERAPVEPMAVAGHSIGEYAALFAAGVFDFEVGLGLVRRRAELMREAAEHRPGGMAAVLGLDAETVHECCRRAAGAGVVVVANMNCPGQVVISGDEAGLGAATERAREAGAKRVVRLPVSGAFHSPLMVTAEGRLYEALAESPMHDPIPPVVVNVQADYCRSASDLPALLRMQVSGPVRWEDSVRLLERDGIEHILEVGVGNVLAGLVRRISPAVAVTTVDSAEALGSAAELLSSWSDARV